MTDLGTTLPAKYYADPQYYEIERREIFNKEWQCVGFEYQLEAEGAYVREEIAGTDVFVRRSPDGSLRAFHNCCPHRAGPIVTETEGRTRGLTCKYHGWTFTDDGSLLNARDFGAPAPEGACLRQAQVETWNGIVFVNLDLSAPDLRTWFNGWDERMNEWPMEGVVFHSQSRRLIDCNWKTYGDTYIEGYHIPLVHPGLNRMTEGLKYRVWNHGDRRWNVHLTPHPDDADIPGTFTCIWPNFGMDIYEQGWSTERWCPRGPHSTELIRDYFFWPDTERADIIVKESEEVAIEDVVISTAVQRNLDAGWYSEGRMSPRHENGLADWHEIYREVIVEGGPAKAVGPNPVRNPTS